MNLAELKLLANACTLLCRLPIYLISMSEQRIKLAEITSYTPHVCGLLQKKQGNTHFKAYSYMLNLFSCQKNVKQGKGSYTIRNLDSTSVKQHKT